MDGLEELQQNLNVHFEVLDGVSDSLDIMELVSHQKVIVHVVVSSQDLI